MIHRIFSTLVLVSSSLVAQSPANPKLAEYRAQIDKIDQQIVELLNQRASVVDRIGVVKKQMNLPIAAPGRERQVLDHVADVGKNGPLPPDAIRRIYEMILQEMRKWEASNHTP